MDILKQELLEKRKTLVKNTGLKRFFKRSEIQQKQIQKLREQEKLELEAKAQRQIAELRKRKDRDVVRVRARVSEGRKPSADKDLKRTKANFEDEDKIFFFFKRLLNEWKQELDEMPEAEKRTAKGKSAAATFKQCARYLNPKVLPDGVRRDLMLFVECCMKRDYIGAMDHYIKMTIGNAPWPIGVTMVGIHERSAREKIYANTNSVAHIMNDETTLKYLHSVKRLMTFCQLRYPTVPSKSVDFNSLGMLHN